MKEKKKSKLQSLQDETQIDINKTDEKIEVLYDYTSGLYYINLY